MKTLGEFFRLFFTTDYFLILLIILLLIVLVIIIHLIRVQNYYKKNEVIEEEEKPEENFLTLNFGKEPIEEPSIKEHEINPRLQDKFESIEKILSGKTAGDIEEYEKNEEETAIISTKELESISKARGFETSNNASLINQYEEEQEKKAIISYEELLKNASGLKLNYKDENYDINGPIVRKVELETPVIERNLNYVEETNFLSTLKEFRETLK